MEGIDYTGNQYQWAKDGVILDGETGTTLTISTITKADSGNYVVRVTNPDAPNLTLTSERSNVSVLFNSTSDSLGNLPERYITAQIEVAGKIARTSLPGPCLCRVWSHLSTNGRVTGLDLSSNGLTGSLPAELGNLSELQSLDVSSNGLTGALPAGLGRPVLA